MLEEGNEGREGNEKVSIDCKEGCASNQVIYAPHALAQERRLMSPGLDSANTVIAAYVIVRNPKFNTLWHDDITSGALLQLNTK